MDGRDRTNPRRKAAAIGRSHPGLRSETWGTQRVVKMFFPGLKNWTGGTRCVVEVFLAGLKGETGGTRCESGLLQGIDRQAA